jgi:hypothetical protein
LTAARHIDGECSANRIKQQTDHPKTPDPPTQFVEEPKKDKRYARAFARWLASGAEERLRLRDCLAAERLSDSSVDRCMREVRALGFSGLVPPSYFAERSGQWQMWGMSRKDFAKSLKRIEGGKPVKRYLERGRENMEPAFAAVRRMATSAADQSGLPVAIVPVQAVKAAQPKKVKRVKPLWLPTQGGQQAVPTRVKLLRPTKRKVYA